MAIELGNNKKPKLLDTSRAYLSGLAIRIYVNDYTPVPGMTALPVSGFNRGNFVECPDGGADAQSATYGTPTLNVAQQAEMSAVTLTWTFLHDAGDFTIYGIFATDDADDEVVWAERAPTPMPVTVSGQTFSVTIKYRRDTMP